MFTQTFNKRKIVRLAQMVSHIVKKVGSKVPVSFACNTVKKGR